MMWKRVFAGGLILGCGVLLADLVSPEVAFTYPSGAPAGFAGDNVSNGAPMTCRVCHSGNDLNDSQGGGSVTIDAPESVAPGETITISVTLVNNTPATPSGRRQGFSATVKDPSNNAFVGSYTLPDPAAVQLTSGNTAYVTHTFAGSGLTTWTFQWTAPATEVPSEVVIYAAGNAANGQGTTGDYIYTDTHTISLASVAADDGPRADIGVEWSSLAPNPVQGRARAELVLAAPMDVAVRLVDGRGRLVRELASGFRPGGASAVDVDVRNLPSGMYFLVAETAAGQCTQAVNVVR